MPQAHATFPEIATPHVSPVNNSSYVETPAQLVWTVILLLVAIGLATAVRRTYVLLSPPERPRFAAGAALDAPVG